MPPQLGILEAQPRVRLYSALKLVLSLVASARMTQVPIYLVLVVAWKPMPSPYLTKKVGLRELSYEAFDLVSLGEKRSKRRD